MVRRSQGGAHRVEQLAPAVRRQDRRRDARARLERDAGRSVRITGFEQPNAGGVRRLRSSASPTPRHQLRHPVGGNRHPRPGEWPRGAGCTVAGVALLSRVTVPQQIFLGHFRSRDQPVVLLVDQLDVVAVKSDLEQRDQVAFGELGENGTTDQVGESLTAPEEILLGLDDGQLVAAPPWPERAIRTACLSCRRRRRSRPLRFGQCL